MIDCIGKEAAMRLYPTGWPGLILVIVLLLSCGCGESSSDYGSLGDVPGSFAKLAERPSASPEVKPQKSQDDLRQIIRTARLAVKVADFHEAQAKVRSWAGEKNGYVSHSEQKRESEDAFSGTITLKVPREFYTETIDFLRGLGKVYELFETAEDVTDQVVDFKSRLRNAQELEERILRLLKDQTGSIADIIEAERELAKLRKEIEQMQGRLKGLTRKITYATFTVHLFVSGSRDIEARAWYGPLYQDLRDLGFVIAGSLGALITAVVAAAPWIFVLWLVKRWYTRRKERINRRLNAAKTIQPEGE